FLAFNFSWFGQEERVEELAGSYLKIISFSVMPMILFLSAKQFADGLSFTLPSMLITLLAIPVNALLNWLLIYGHAGMPALVLDGAGYATSITRVFIMLGMSLDVIRSMKIRPYVVPKPKLTVTFTRKVM